MIIPVPVSAYLDPGVGSMIWQMVAAAIFGMTFALKMYWTKIKNFFSKHEKDKTDD
jgi:hypothetical protein